MAKGEMTDATKPTLHEPVKDPARLEWHEVSKVAHYWLEVNGMTRADIPVGVQMQVREKLVSYRKSEGTEQ